MCLDTGSQLGFTVLTTLKKSAMSDKGEPRGPSRMSGTPEAAARAETRAETMPNVELGVPKFNLGGDPNELNERWTKWLRGFKLFLRAKGVTDDQQKVALLLHSGGYELQDLFFTLGGDDTGTFDNATKTLDDHFTPKKNIPYERYLFRKMRQAVDESVDEFVYRLRRKAVFCEFNNTDDAIRDQLIETCRNSAIRRKFLESAETSLERLLESARSIEAVERQLRELEVGRATEKPGTEVNAVRGPQKKGSVTDATK